MCKTGGPRCHGEKVKTAANSFEKAKQDFSKHQSNSDVDPEVLERSAKEVEEKRVEYAKRVVDHLVDKELQLSRLEERAGRFWGQETSIGEPEDKKVYEEGVEAYKRYKDASFDEPGFTIPDVDLYKLTGLRDLMNRLRANSGGVLNKTWKA